MTGVGEEEAGEQDRADPPDRREAARTSDDIGELLPEVTRDESADGWGDEDDPDSDAWLRRQVPPHHG